MYKVAVVTGDVYNLSSTIKQTIEQINEMGGKIDQIVQSQSSNSYNHTILTVTILYRVEKK